jgi:hypothetical protein
LFSSVTSRARICITSAVVSGHYVSNY